MSKIAVLLSGGVDSSLAAYLLKREGHRVTGVYLKIWLEDELSFLGDCPWKQDLFYTKKLCSMLSIPLEIINLQREYRETIVSYTISQVKAGNTPNPDILCNQRIKFGVAWDRLANRFDMVATGHYARILRSTGNTVSLHISPDQIKDQTYFLSYLSQAQLKRALFPIGHLTKSQVRAQAHALGLPTSQRRDSQGICFLGKIKFSAFMEQYLGKKEGKLIEFESGDQVGIHDGFWYYTIGQRRRIGLSGGPWYVVAKNTAENIVYISRRYFDSEKKRRSFVMRDINWLTAIDQKHDNLTVKLRHGAKQYQCTVSFLKDKRLHIRLKEDDQGIASGQFAVLYHGTQCIAAGVIDHEQGYREQAATPDVMVVPGQAI